MNRSIQALAALIVVVGTINAQAAAKYWDRDAGGVLLHGDGTWNTTDANWNATANGSGALTTFASGTDQAFFNGSDGTSVVRVTNAVSTSSSWLTMQGSGYTISITNGGGLTGYQTYLGQHQLASNNTIQVFGGEGVTSVFNAQYEVYVGSGGTNFNNRLVVDGAGYAGSAVVTNVRDLVVGDAMGSISNGIQIINGGRLYHKTFNSDYFRIGANPGSMGNYLMVTNGSLLSYAVDQKWFKIGTTFTTNNWMLIQGGPLGPSICQPVGNLKRDLWIGYGNTNFNNRMIVDGAGVVGGAIMTNIGNTTLTSIDVGGGPGAVSNSLQIINGGIVYMRPIADSLYAVVGNGPLRSDNSLIITNGGQLRSVFSMYIGGAQATNNYALVQGGALGTSLIEASGNNGVFVGIGASSFNNRLTVDGQGIAGSAMVTNAGPLNVGATGAGARSNSVQIVNGGVFKNAQGTLIGAVAGSYENFMTITNGGEFHFGNTVEVGSRGNAGGGSSNNWLLVQGGNSVTSVARDMTATARAWYIGGSGSTHANCVSNRVTVDGLGFYGSAVITNVSSLTLGNPAGNNGNRLEVLNGGLVRMGGILTVGALAGVTGNVVRIDGGDVRGVTALNVNGTLGSVEVSNNGQMYLGALAHNIGSGAGGSNMLSVSSSGLLDGALQNMNLGYLGSTGNLLRVNGGTVTNINSIFIGETLAGSGYNEMVITNAGKVFTRAGSIGASTAGQVSNRVTVTGSGSVWNLQGYNLTVGLHTTTGNVLTVDGGGMVTNVGVLNIGSNNMVNLRWGTLVTTNFNASNQTATVLGDGVNPAGLFLSGGTGNFTNGLLVQSNAMLYGTGKATGSGVVLTNGGAISPGAFGASSAALVVSNLTWHGQGVYRCDISDATGGEGAGWDRLDVGQITAVLNGGKLVIRLAGAAVNLDAGSDYSFKILAYTNATVLGASDFEVDYTTEGFQSGNWSVSNNATAKAFYLNYSGLVTPAAPSGLSASAAAYNQIDLLWTDNSGNETGFKIERSPNGSSGWTAIFTNAVNVNAFTNTGLSGETPYYYRVRAYNAAGDSAYSAVANATTPPGPPADPSALSLTPVSTSQINLSWADNSGNETGFEIQRKTGAGGYAMIAAVAANVTAYTNTGLDTDTLYYYQVRATNAASQSAYCTEASASTWPNPPTAPSGLSATAMSKVRIDLGWTDNASNETGFKIERRTGAGGVYAQIATVGANIAAYTNTGLDAFTEYYYRVSATNIGGASSTIEASATTLDDRRYVAKHGLNTYPGTQAQPWGTIQYAVTNVQSGDRIFIGEGIYTENVVLTNTIHSLTIKGGHNTNDWSWSPSNHVTVISGAAGARIQLGGDSSFNGLPSVSNTIMGLTLIGGQYGVLTPYHVSAKSTVTISHCVITNQGAGFGIYGYGPCDFNIVNTVIAKGAIGIYHNGAAGFSGTNTIYNCTFVTNSRANIWVPNGGKTIIRNTIAYGAYGTGGGGNEGYGIAAGATAANSADVSHSVVYGNTVNTNGLVAYGDGMITNAAPVFVNYAAGNYRLTKDSPGMNQGITIPAITNDLDLNPRPWGRPHYDMGAYEIYSPPLNSVFRFR